MLAGAAACKALTPDFDAVIAIDVTVPDSVIDIGDTTHPRGFAVNARGDSTAATLVWSALDSTLDVVDSLTGAAVGLSAGPGRLVARAGALRSNPVAVNVLGPLDSIAAGGKTVDTVAASDTISDSLKVLAYSGINASAHRHIALSIDFPPGGTGVTLFPADTIVTGSLGFAAFFVLPTGVRPDSVVVSATATYHGVPVTGSPTRFVVVFLR